MNLIEKAKEISKTFLTKSRFEHAERVVGLLETGTDEEFAAAYLHDILEDTNLTEDTLRHNLGKEVMDIVKELTNSPESYRSFIRDFSHFIHAGREAKRIKLCDRIDNIKKRINAGANANYYVEESEKLLGYLKDADERLANILSELIEKLKINCNKYVHEDIL